MQVTREALSRFLSWEPRWTMEDGLVLRGLTALFRATGDEKYKNLILNYMQAGVSESGNTLKTLVMIESPHDPASCGNTLLFAWHETGEERYKKALSIIISHMEADPPPALPWELYGTLPFMAEYDTQFGGKQAYKTIVRQFTVAHDQLFAPEKGLYRTWLHQNELGFSLQDEGLMLMALVDTIEKMDMQIYEHYRALADLFLIAVKGLVRWQDQDTGLLHRIIDQKETQIDWGGNAMGIYAIRKGVRMGLLDEEKYLPLAKRAYTNLVGQIHASSELFDEWLIGPVVMAQAEMWEGSNA